MINLTLKIFWFQTLTVRMLNTLSAVRDHDMYICDQQCPCEAVFWEEINKNNHSISSSFIHAYNTLLQHRLEVNMTYHFKLFTKVRHTFGSSPELLYHILKYK